MRFEQQGIAGTLRWHTPWASGGRIQWALNPVPAERYLYVLSFLLLLSSCIEAGAIQQAFVAVWLVSLLFIGLISPGAALGLYITAVTLFAKQSSGGRFVFLEAPDQAGLLAILLSVGLLRPDPIRRWFSDRVLVVGSLFIAYCVFSLAFHNSLSFTQLAYILRSFAIPIGIYIVFSRSRPTLKDFKMLCIALVVLGGYNAVEIILWKLQLDQWLFPSWLNDPMHNAYAYTARPGGLLMQPAWDALLVSLILAVALFVYRVRLFRYSGFLLAFIAFACVGVFFTYNRAAYIPTAIIIFAAFWIRREAGEKTKRLILRRRAALAGFVLFVVMMAALPAAQFKERVGNEGTVVWRLELWETALAMIPNKPLLGYGPGGFSGNAVYFLVPDATMHSVAGMKSGGPIVHNTTLHIAVELGLIGLMLYGIVLVLVIRRALGSAVLLYGRDGLYFVSALVFTYLFAIQFAVGHDPATNIIVYGLLGTVVGVARGFEQQGEYETGSSLTWRGWLR